jgi:hypothetical protein
MERIFHMTFQVMRKYLKYLTWIDQTDNVFLVLIRNKKTNLYIKAWNIGENYFVSLVVLDSRNYVFILQQEGQSDMTLIAFDVNLKCFILTTLETDIKNQITAYCLTVQYAVVVCIFERFQCVKECQVRTEKMQTS